jgi:hypothetical protein
MGDHLLGVSFQASEKIEADKEGVDITITPKQK